MTWSLKTGNTINPDGNEGMGGNEYKNSMYRLERSGFNGKTKGGNSE